MKVFTKEFKNAVKGPIKAIIVGELLGLFISSLLFFPLGVIILYVGEIDSTAIFLQLFYMLIILEVTAFELKHLKKLWRWVD